MTEPELPPQADAFIRRLATLPESAWREMLDRSRPRFRGWLWGLWFGLTLPFRQRQLAAVQLTHSEAAARRVDELLRSAAIPAYLSWRVKPMVHVAVQALCSVATLTPREFKGSYAPFEPFIPSASLPLPPERASVGRGA